MCRLPSASRARSPDHSVGVDRATVRRAPRSAWPPDDGRAVSSAALIEPPQRFARLVLVTPTGDVLGVRPSFPVATPWWQDIGPVVQAAREHLGLDVTILRFLEVERPAPPGGVVTYLAEVPEPVDADPWRGSLDEQPLRHPYARPGGPAADLAWADTVLAEQGLRRTAAEQIRTWNLSSLWRIEADGRLVWLKVVPPFFGHEGALLARLHGEPVPEILAHDGGRILMPEIPGEDLYGADLPLLRRMVPILVRLQAAWLGGAEELVALGLPDWRPDALTRAIDDVVERTSDELSREDLSTLRAFVGDLPERFARLAETGLGDTLVHGDFHPGNLRGGGDNLVLLDWGDSGVGHPLLDQAAFLDRIRPDAVEPIHDLWRAEWEAAVPGSDPDRAAEILRPVAAARQAHIYRKFLDNIEPAEHPYHAADPADWLTRTADLVRGER